MTQEQREKLFQILGSIEGLTWGVEDPHISECFCGVTEDLAKLLEEDAEPKEVAPPDADIPCNTCQYENADFDEPPCCDCKHNYIDNYKRRVTDGQMQ